MDYCTIYNNTAKEGGGIANKAVGENVRIDASIVASNHASTDPDILGSVASWWGSNLIQNVSATQLVTTSGIFGEGALQSTIIGKSPDVGPLQNNGGLTLTHALLPGSPAIDQIGFNQDSVLCNPLTLTDQRGFPRPEKPGGACDIGAYEYQG